MYCKALTKQELIDMGIKDVTWDYDNQQWWIDRYWYKNTSSTKMVHTHVSVNEVVCKHKYSTDKAYLKVQWNYKGKCVALPLSRFLYVWFIGDVPEGYVVDHIDNNPFNNQLNNLRMLSISENLRKRYADNPNACHNQWDAMRR